MEVNSSSPNPVLNPSPSPASSLPRMASSPPFIASAFNNNNHQKNKQNKAAQVHPPGAGHSEQRRRCAGHRRAWPAAAAYGRLPSPAAGPSSLGLWRRERGPDPGTPGRGARAGAVATPPSVRDSEWSRRVHGSCFCLPTVPKGQSQGA